MLDLNILPWEILAVTFTNRAAREMKERMEKLVEPDRAKAMSIGTFHALCVRVLKAEGKHLVQYGLTPSFTIFDTKDQRQVVKQAIEEVDLSALQIDLEHEAKEADILAAISRAKSHVQTPEQLEESATTLAERIAAKIYQRYHALLRKSNGVDFDDLLGLTEHLWRTEPTVLRRYQQRWSHLHVDEFQDCNLTQYNLIRLLGRGTQECQHSQGNVCVVGDDDQMIYTWRGASAENVTRFEADFAGCKLILLEQNYRSTQPIIDAAQTIVQKNTNRKEKKLWTDKKGGAPIRLFDLYNDQEEARAVAREIRRLKMQGHVQHWSDIACLYRMNSQPRVLEQQLRLAVIPYLVIGSRSFFDREEIRDMVAFLRVLANPHDTISLERIINKPNRRIGTKTVGTLRTYAEQHNISLYQTCEHTSEIPKIGKSAAQSFAQFHQVLDDLIQQSQKLTLPELIDAILEQTGYGQELATNNKEDIDRGANVAELRRVADEFEANEEGGLLAFLAQLSLTSGADIAQTEERNGRLKDPKKQDAVHLLTLHAAKGLEYPAVLILGMDQGCLPHSRSLLDRQQLEEERRLAYVGFTRAMQWLTLFRAQECYSFGETRATERSQFLDDISQLLEEW